MHCKKKYESFTVKKFKTCLEPGSICPGLWFILLRTCSPKAQTKRANWEALTCCSGDVPPLWWQLGHHPLLHKLWCTAGLGEFAEHLQEGCILNLWFISVAISPALGSLGKSLAQALLFIPLGCSARWRTLSGSTPSPGQLPDVVSRASRRGHGAVKGSPPSVSQLAREGRGYLLHDLPKASTNRSQNRPHLQGCLLFGPQKSDATGSQRGKVS